MGEYGKRCKKWLSAALASCVGIAFAGTLGAVAMSASAAEDDHMFCEAGDRNSRVTYFSAIFLGDYSYGSARARLDFHNYLKDAGRNPDFSSTFCWPGTIYGEDTYERAEWELEQKVRERQWYPYSDWAVVRTEWKPGHSDQRPPSDSDDSRGRESGGDGCYFGECPDDVDPATQSPNTPSRQASQRTLICQTSEGWCQMSTELPVDVPCGCLTLDGPVGGITVPSRP